MLKKKEKKEEELDPRAEEIEAFCLMPSDEVSRVCRNVLQSEKNFKVLQKPGTSFHVSPSLC